MTIGSVRERERKMRKRESEREAGSGGNDKERERENKKVSRTTLELMIRAKSLPKSSFRGVDDDFDKI